MTIRARPLGESLNAKGAADEDGERRAGQGLFDNLLSNQERYKVRKRLDFSELADGKGPISEIIEALACPAHFPR